MPTDNSCYLFILSYNLQATIMHISPKYITVVVMKSRCSLVLWVGRSYFKMPVGLCTQKMCSKVIFFMALSVQNAKFGTCTTKCTLSPNSRVSCSTRGVTNSLSVTKRRLDHVPHDTSSPGTMFTKIKYFESSHDRGISFCSTTLLWCRNRSCFSNILKGKVWIVRCQIKAAQQLHSI